MRRSLDRYEGRTAAKKLLDVRSVQLLEGKRMGEVAEGIVWGTL